MRTLICFLIFCFTSSVWSAPVVNHVVATQVDQTVSVTYDLTSDNPCVVSIQASSDSGATWVLPISSVTGDIGGMILPGTGKQITWNYKVDIPDITGNKFKVRICAVEDNRPQAPDGMIAVAAADFVMGDSFHEGDPPETTQHNVHIDAYFIDKYLVTAQKYVDALNWAKQNGLVEVRSNLVYSVGGSIPYCDTSSSMQFSPINWDGNQFTANPAKNNHPVVLVNWYGAAAYCNWRSLQDGKQPAYDTSWNCSLSAGYRLPTEAEWEYASRGGLSDHRFPWSDTDKINSQRANYYSTSSPYYDTGTAGYNAAFSTGSMPYTSPVDYFPANTFGLFDMCGNTFQWCSDWYGEGYYQISPVDNPSGPATGTYRSLRGGSWSSNAFCLRCSYRSSALPNYKAITNGFRTVLRQ